MRGIRSKLSELSWKWRFVLILLLTLFIVVVVAPAAMYLSRARDVPDYSGIQTEAMMKYLVHYDSGDGLVNECTFIVKVAETDVIIDSEACFHIVAIINPYPRRKAYALIIGSAEVTKVTEEFWRSQDDLRILHEEAMQIDLPLVNTAVTQITYSEYDGYPGWPYSLGDSWTYKQHYEPDTILQSPWNDLFYAEVVADDVIVDVGDMEYECLKVVHTLLYTDHKVSPGAGVGATIIEYWPKNGMPIAPLKSESTVDFIGLDARIMIDADPLPPL